MKKLVNRSAQRGAVFVESIVVISFFTLCFLGVLYFRELYLAKLRVQRLARASAMSHAMGACERDPAAGLEKDLPARPVEKGREPGESRDIDTHGDKTAGDALAKFDRAKTGTPLDEITKITLTTSASATTRKDQASKEEGFRSDAVSSTSFVTCGDPVADGQYEEIFPHIESLFDSFF